MTAKQTRYISKCFEVVIIGFIVFGILLLIGAAGMGDFYALELHSDVPGNEDMKMIFWSFICFVSSGLIGVIDSRIDYSNMYNLDGIPVYFTANIENEANRNDFFSGQLKDALDSFYNGEWGDVDVVRREDNDVAFKSGIGAIVGLYHTIRGTVCIVTNNDRTATEMAFEREY